MIDNPLLGEVWATLQLDGKSVGVPETIARSYAVQVSILEFEGELLFRKALLSLIT